MKVKNTYYRTLHLIFWWRPVSKIMTSSIISRCQLVEDMWAYIFRELLLRILYVSFKIARGLWSIVGWDGCSGKKMTLNLTKFSKNVYFLYIATWYKYKLLEIKQKLLKLFVFLYFSCFNEFVTIFNPIIIGEEVFSPMDMIWKNFET